MLKIEQFTIAIDRALRACHTRVVTECPNVLDIQFASGKELKAVKDQLPRALRKIVKSDMCYLTVRIKLVGENEKEAKKSAITEAEKYVKALLEDTLGMKSSEGGVKGEIIPADPDPDDKDADRASVEQVAFFVVEIKL